MVRFIRLLLNEKGRFLWSAHRITEKQKAGKARNIKEKQLKNSRNTVSKQLVAHRSSASDNLRDGHEPCDIKYKKLCPCLHGAELFYLMSWGEARDREKPEVFEGRKANDHGKSRFSGIFLYLNGLIWFDQIWQNESRFHPIFSGPQVVNRPKRG